MSVMIRSDFVTMRNSLLQLLGICVLIAVFVSIGTGTPIAGVAAVCAMVPFMFIFSIAAYDDMNGWERFRLTLPISRRQVVLGRYASCLIVVLASDVLMIILITLLCAIFPFLTFIPSDARAWIPSGLNLARMSGFVLMISGAMLFAAACTMPLIMRFGMTKGTRLAPLVVVFLIMGILFVIGNFEESIVEMAPSLELVFGVGEEGALLALGLGAIIFVAVLVLYAASAVIAIRLYDHRQF